ncbi:MAG: hypothetical protein KDE31_29585, partial [Caldilineaceae bacterium]|nr:hypothetical protein [Caldilineaceae bacterium]
DELWQQGLVRAHDHQRYDFSHDRIREVAYLAVGPVQRPLWHRRVAAALEDLYAVDLAPVSSQLAFHWEEAGEVERAIEYYRRAAEITHALFADEETLNLLYRAWTLVEPLPTTRQNKERELALLLQLRVPLMVARGYDELTLGTIGLRAKALAEEVGSREQLFQALHCLRIFHQMRGAYHAARSTAEQMVALADSKDPSLFVQAHLLLAHTLFYQGEFVSAQAHFDLLLQFPPVPVQPLIFIAKTRWLFGYPEQAQQYANLAMDTANREHQPHLLAFATINLARLYYFMHQLGTMRQLVEKALTLDATSSNRLFLILVRLFQGRLWAEDGEIERGIEQIRAMLAKLDAKQHAAFRTHFLGLLAEAYACAGQFAEALDTLHQALEFVERNGEGVWHAELVRLQ